ncbi:hypothetical protein F5883DRAFT_442405 [Diaporthe sp. PMI_573]|nr:hypothetical protein F5883DRAFT_442405 [Diaporthaceae sp. PMI_573]
MQQNFPGVGSFNDIFSHEGLHRIITQAREANLHLNAAPPASESAIEKLEKKEFDRQMMGVGEKVDCSICIEEYHFGDEVTILPCKHWFHGECVIPWLRQRNTCPICRGPVKSEGNKYLL